MVKEKVFDLPVSMTATQSGIVIEVSAIFVDTTTFLLPFGAVLNIDFCSADVKPE